MNNTTLDLMKEKQGLIIALQNVKKEIVMEREWQKGFLEWVEKRPLYDKRDLIYDSNEQIEVCVQEMTRVENRLEEIDKEIYAGKELEEIENNERGNW